MPPDDSLQEHCTVSRTTTNTNSEVGV